MAERKWLWLAGIPGTMTVSCAVCGCVVEIALRSQHVADHLKREKGDGQDHTETTTIP